MRRVFPLLLLIAPAFYAGAQEQESEVQTIFVGETEIFDLAGEDSLRLALDATGTVLIQIGNIGRDTVLTIRDTDGNRILRSAGWRGPEHHYVATIDLSGPIELSIEPDVPISPPGQVSVSVTPAADSSVLAGERRMTNASNLILAYYYGESNTRTEALDAFLDAAELFDTAGNKARQADALFEAANVSDALCYRTQTHELLEEAGALWAELGDQAGIAASENLRGLTHWATGNGDAAMALFETSASRRERPREDFFYARHINNLGLVHRDRGDARLASQYFLSALEIWQGDVDFLTSDLSNFDYSSVGQPPWLQQSLTAVSNLGWAQEVFGDVQETQALWQRALELTNALNNDFNAAVLQNNLGNLKRKSGEMQEAMQLLETALAFFTEESPDDRWAGIVYFNIAQLYRDLGDRTRAMEALQQSLLLRTPDCDPVGRAESLREIAEIDVDADRNEQALETIQEAQALLQPYPGNDIPAARLTELEGVAYLNSGRLGEALIKFDDAIRLYRGAGDRYGELTSRTYRARTNSSLGRHFPAIAELRTALDLAEQVDSRLESFRVLTALGEIFLEDDQPDTALQHARRALSISESVREQLVRPILLRDFASVQRSAYDVLVLAYMKLGQVEEAWTASDSGRARRFSDVVRRSEVDFSALTMEQQARYETLMSTIAQRADARTRLLVRNEQESADVVLQELLPLVDEMDLIHDLARRPEAEAVESTSLAELQESLSANDVVLEYYVGSTQSGVWSISNDALAFKETGDATQLISDIEALSMSIRQRQPDVTDKLRQVAEKLVAETGLQNSTKTNAIIIPDGPLHYLPFASLPDPATDYVDPLIENRTISYLPSVSALNELRRRDQVQGEGIAIIADPVFQENDPRVQQNEIEPDVQRLALLDRELLRSAERNGLTGFPRLPGTMAEALAIEEAAGEMPVQSLYGADANRDIVVSGGLRPFEILHFATHGVLDDEEPALSGIVLSAVTLDGQPQNSFLRSQDIAGLSLDASLVVLSGCETGLGRSVSGEGILGLSRAFFYAGAEQVISTLWQVPDQATAELMGHFYRELLQQGASAPEALRSAQLKIRENARWQSPFYWAPFILQGDWQTATDQVGEADRSGG